MKKFISKINIIIGALTLKEMYGDKIIDDYGVVLTRLDRNPLIPENVGPSDPSWKFESGALVITFTKSDGAKAIDIVNFYAKDISDFEDADMTYISTRTVCRGGEDNLSMKFGLDVNKYEDILDRIILMLGIYI